MAEQYQEGEVLKGSDGKTYIVVGGVPREQVSAPAIEGGVYRLPTSPQKAAEEARKERGAEIAESAEQRAVGGEQRDITKQITDLQKDYRGYDSYKKYTAAVGLYNAGLNTQPNTAGDLELITYAAKMRDPTTGVLGGEEERTRQIETYVNQIKAEVAKQFGWKEGGTLTPEGREFLRTNLRNAFENNFRPLYLQDREYFTQQAAASGIDPVRIVGPDPYDAYKESIEGYWKPKVDAQGREIVAPEIRVAEGAEFSTDADFQRQRDNAEAWAATQGLPFDQALAQFNAAMQAKGYGPAGPETIEVLRWYEQNMPGNRAGVQWVLPKTGVREAEAPGRAAALGSGLLTGATAGMAEEVVGLFDPVAAAKLEAAKKDARENYSGTELIGEIIGGVATPLSRIGRGGTIAGEAQRGAIYGGLMGGGEAPAGTDLTERLTQGVIGAGLGGITGGAAQRVFGRAAPAGVAPEVPSMGGVTPEMPPAGVAAPEMAPVPGMAQAAPEMPPVPPAAAPAAGGAPAAPMVGEEMIALAQKAVSRTPGASKARAQLAELAKANPQAQEAANRLGLELPVDVLSDNAQLQAVTGLTRSQIGSEAQQAWRETVNAATDRAHQAMDELDAVTDISQVSADVFDRLDKAQMGLGKQASELRQEVTDAIDPRGRVDANRIRTWLEGRIADLGGGKEGLANLSPEEKRLWGIVSKGQPTYALLNEQRDLIGQALEKSSGPWANTNMKRLKEIYGALADDQINFIESSAGKEVADKQRAANTLFKQMYEGREQMERIFTKNLSGSLAPLMQRAITQGTKGNVQTLNTLVKIIPEDMRGKVLTSALFKAAKTTEDTFSFTNFANIYRDLRSNSEVYKQFAKAVGPEGDKLLTDLYAISRRLSDADKAISRTGASTQLQLLNTERLLSRILMASGGAAGAGLIGSMLGGPGAAIVGAGLAAAAPEIAQRVGKTNAQKLHNLMSSDEFRTLAVSAATNEGLERNINRVAGSKTFRDYLSAIGVNPKNGRDWLRSAINVTASSAASRQGEQQQPMVTPTMKAPQ